MKGYFGIGVWHAKHEVNTGSLWRSAHAFGAAFCFTVGQRFDRRARNTVRAWSHVPLLAFACLEDLLAHLFLRRVEEVA